MACKFEYKGTTFENKEDLLGFLANEKIIEGQVGYDLKAVSILGTEKASKIFDKGRKNKWPIEKVFTEMQIPKNQKVILKSIYNNLTSVIDDKVIEPTLDDFIVALLANNTFAVEIKVAKKYHTVTADDLQWSNEEGNFWERFEYNGNTYFHSSSQPEFYGDEGYTVYKENKKEISEEEYRRIRTNKFESREEGVPTAHYASLTVPGGVNYQESEISTPEIIPGIKGHAQFSTDQGIGWFRSDTAQQEKGYKLSEEEKDSLRENEGFSEYDINAIEEAQSTSSNIRRILEFQSDLFQKSRGAEDLITKLMDEDGAGAIQKQYDAKGKRYYKVNDVFYISDLNNLEEYSVISKEEYLKNVPKNVIEESKNDFLQLLNNKGNWVNFFIQSIVQDSINKGYKKVLFPTGETASRVEGHQTIAEEIIKINKEIDDQQLLIYNLNKEFKENPLKSAYGKDIIKYNYKTYFKKPDGSWEYYTEGGSNPSITWNESVKLTELVTKKEEMKSQGLEKLKPIESFYTNRVTNTLKKLYKGEVKQITDSHGNTWNEVTLPEYPSKFMLEAKIPKSMQDRFFQSININSNGFIKNYNPFQRAHHVMLADRHGLVFKSGKSKMGQDYGYFHTFSGRAMTIKQLEAHFRNHGSFSSLIDDNLKPVFEEKVQEDPNLNVISEKEVAAKELNHKISQVLFNGIHTPTTAREVIRNIKNSGVPLSQEMQAILPVLIQTKATVKFVKASSLQSEDTYMQYDPVNNVIEVAEDRLHLVQDTTVAVAKFLHEAVHSITYNAINSPNNEKKRALLSKIDAVLSELKETLPTSVQEEFSHQLSSMDEFVAGVFENSDFQELIKGERSLWQKIIDAIRVFLGKETSYNKLISDIVALADIENPGTAVQGARLESKVEIKLDTFQDLLDIQSEVVLPTEAVPFYGIRGEKYNRATRFLGQSSKGTNELMETSIEFGNSIDTLSKAIFDGKEFNYKDSDGKIKSSHFNAVSVSIKNIKKQIEAESPGVKFMTDLYTIDTKNMVIGEADIVAVYPDNKIRVIDMKSIKSGLATYDDSSRNWESYESKHTRQTNYYGNLIEHTGEEILPPYIIAVQPVYNAGDDIIGRFKKIKDGKYATLIKLKRNSNVLKGDNTSSQEKIDKAQEVHKDWRAGKEYKEDFSELNLKKLDNLSRILLQNIKAYANISKHAGREETSAKLEKIQKKMERRLRKDISELNTISYLKTINEFLLYSNDFFVNINKRFDNVISNEYYDFEEYNDLYGKSNSFINSFDIVKDLQALAVELHKEGTITTEEKETLDSKFSSIAAYKSKVTIKLQQIRKTVMEKQLNKSMYNKKVIIDFREKYGKEYEEMFGADSFFRGSKTKKWKEAKSEFVAKKMYENRELIEKETRKYVKTLLDNPTVDLTGAGFMISSDPIINNPFIQMLHNLLLEGHDNYKIEVVEKTQELAKKANRLKLKRADFKKIVEIDSKGNHYLRGEYKLAFFEKFKELQLAANKEENKLKKSKKEKILKNWLRANSTKTSNGLYAPKAKWKNSFKDLTIGQQEALDIFKEITEISAHDTRYRKSLIRKVNSRSTAGFYRLPAILATTYANAAQGQLFDAAKKKMNEMFTVERDDTEEGASLEKAGESKAFRVYTDVAGKPIDTLAINYRSQIGKKQNMDLFTIYALELENGVRFKNNFKLETTSLIFKDFIKEKKFINTRGFTKTALLSIFKDTTLEDYDTISGESSNTYKKLDSMIKNRVFNVTNVYAGKIAGADANRVVGTLIQYSSMLGMAVHIPNAMNNLVTGMLANFIDAHGGDVISKQNITEAFAEYSKEMPGIMADIGAPQPKNIINLLLQRFDVMGEYSQLHNQFERNNKLKQLLKTDSLTGLHGMGEHAMHAVMMISVLKSVKAMNKSGEFIDKEGNVVDIKKAASVYDMFYKDDKGILRNKEIGFTSLDPINSWEAGGSFSIKGLIKDRIYRTQGAYDQSMNGHWQKFWYGKLFMHFKKFFESLLLNRMRGMGHVNKPVGNLTDEQLYYNYNTQMKEFGYYTTFVRMLLQTIKQHKFNILRYRGSVAGSWKEMSDHERANIRKATLEIGIITFIGTLAGAIAGAADGDDYFLWLTAYLAARQENELKQFYDPSEAWRLIKNPIASMRQLESITNILELLFSPFEWGEVYESGLNAGRSKASVKFQRTVVPTSFNFDAKRMYNFYDKN